VAPAGRRGPRHQADGPVLDLEEKRGPGRQAEAAADLRGEQKAPPVVDGQFLGTPGSFAHFN